MENTRFVIPAQAGIQTSGFQKYSKDHRHFKLLDSRLRGNDDIQRLR